VHIGQPKVNISFPFVHVNDENRLNEDMVSYITRFYYLVAMLMNATLMRIELPKEFCTFLEFLQAL
jgi:hypothetical protein